MGNRQSVVVLKEGDWCLYRSYRLCRIGGFDDFDKPHIRVYWADVDALGYAPKEHLTLLPPELTPILSDSIKE